MQNNPVKVSIIISVYATEAYLASCLDCAINQTLNEIEIIVVNDASPDNSNAILVRYAERDSRIKYIQHETNLGLVQARLTGLALAAGEYVIFADSDDEMDLALCEKTYAMAIAHEADIVQCGARLVTEFKADTAAYRDLENKLVPCLRSLHGREIFDAFFVEKAYAFSLWGKLFKRSLWVNVQDELQPGGITMGEDLYLYSFIALRANKYIGFSDPLYHYYFGRGISSVGYADDNKEFESLAKWQKYLSIKMVCDRVEGLLQKKGLLDNYRSALANWKSVYFSASCYNFLLVALPLKASAFNLLCSVWGGDVTVESLLTNQFDHPELSLWLHDWWRQLLVDVASPVSLSEKYSLDEISRLLPLLIARLAQDLKLEKKSVYDDARFQIQKIQDQTSKAIQENDHLHQVARGELEQHYKAQITAIQAIHERDTQEIKNQTAINTLESNESLEMRLREELTLNVQALQKHFEQEFDSFQKIIFSTLSWRVTKPLRLFKQSWLKLKKWQLQA